MNTSFTISYKNIFKALAVILLLIVISCKKEFYNTEMIDPVHSAKVDEYLKLPKAKFVSFASFTKNVSMTSLGNLKEVMLNSHSSSNGMMASGPKGSAKARYKVITDSAKLLVVDGRSNYVFTIQPVTPRAVTFRNLTISRKGSTVYAFMTTYTPTRRWAKNYMLGKIEKFEGRIGFTPIDLNDNDILSMTQLPISISSTAAAQNKKPGGASTQNFNCTVVPIYGQQAFPCKSGAHMPGDILCALTGPDRAGYIDAVQGVTFDCSGGGNGDGGGSGETTVTPPGVYHPCNGVGEGDNNENTPGETEIPGEEIDETICGPITPPKDIRNKTTDTCISKTVEAALGANGNIEGMLAGLIQGFDASKTVTVNIYNGTTLNNAPGQYQGGGFTNNVFQTNITLNTSLMSNTSKEFAISVLIHEFLHAYIHTSSSTVLQSDHETISNKYIDPMAAYLIDYFGISVKDAYALAWRGVGDSSIFNVNTPTNTEYMMSNGHKITKSEINNISGAYIRKDIYAEDEVVRGSAICN